MKHAWTLTACAALFCGVAWSQEPTPEQKAEQLKQQADEAGVREAAAKQTLDAVQAKAQPFRDALAKLKTEELKAKATVQNGEKELPGKQEAAKKAADAKTPIEEAAKKAADAAKVAADAKAAADLLAKEKADALKIAQDNFAKAKEAADKDANNKDLADAKAAAEKAVADADAAAKDAAAKAAAAEKPATDAAAAAKVEADKAAVAVKAATDAETAAKNTADAVAAAKDRLTKIPDEVKNAETQLAALQPELDAATAALATVHAEAVGKLTAAEGALADLGKFVVFSKSVAPIFAKRCLACHNARTAKGRYNMETFAAVMKGGEQGDTIIPGDGDLSNLSIVIEDGSMPKDADPLTKDEIAIIKKWIALGAKLDAGKSADAPLVTIMPKLPQPNPPETYRVPVPITAVAFNNDGTQLAASGYHEITVYNPADGALVRRITNVAERTYDLKYSPDGTLLAAASGTPAQMGEVKIFNAADGVLLKDLVTTSDAMFGVAFSPDGKRIAACGADRSIRVFDVASGKQELLIEDHADWVMGIAWAPDGAKLASASRDKTSKVFDAKTGESLVTFPGHAEPVYGVQFTPNGAEVMTSGRDKQIRMWNVTNAAQTRAIGGFGNEVYRIAVTPEGRIFSCSADMTAKEHKLDGGAVRNFAGHKDWVYSVAFNPATKKLATGSWDGEIRIWNAEDGMGMTQFVAAPGFKPAAAN